MQQHHANQNPDERLAVALWWKWLWDEDRVGPAVAWRHRWSQAGLVSVDHDGEEWWNLERPSVCDIPCTSELLLSQAAEFFSCYFLEALLDMYMCERCDLYVYTCVHVSVFENTFFHFFLLFCVPKCQITQYFSVNVAILFLASEKYIPMKIII